MPPTIQQVIDTILADIPGAPFAQTVDTVKCGDPSREVTGIVTTFLASCEVLHKAIDLGANFVITHEPTFYNHLDETGDLQADPVYLAKRRLIDDHGLVVWRFHDHWHSHQPDGVSLGVVKTLGWEAHFDPATPYRVVIPPTPLRDLVRHIKERLGVHTARVMGRPDLPCSKIGLMVGAWPAPYQLGALREDIDVLVVGEINEWETNEYVRDALSQGQDRALVILGHALSEEPGMAYLVEWLRARVPGVAITHVPVGDPFRWE
jgi:putative NIF3 family GTP cyclohydrolase 1 type 2